MPKWVIDENSIAFYERDRDEYEFLSNFYPILFIYGGIQFRTLEHAYQRAKTLNPTEQMLIMRAATPADAKRLGSACTVRPDWLDIRVAVMEELIQVKFDNDELRDRLLNTGDKVLIEDSKSDKFWGCGRDGNGENMLGVLLMKERERVRKLYIAGY